MRTPLLVFVLSVAFVDGPARSGDPPLRPVSDEAAWERLRPKAPPLPAWARSLVTALPKTTGAMLDLDRIHRAENPLGAVLAAKLRWLAADTLGCESAKRSTEADLKRAGLTVAEVDEFTLAPRPTAAEKPLFLFARKLSRAAHTVTDAEFAAVLKAQGPEKTCAVVHTLAFANFHFRILQALGVPADADPAVPPLTVAFDPALRAKVDTPARPAWATLAAAKQPRVPVLDRRRRIARRVRGDGPPEGAEAPHPAAGQGEVRRPAAAGQVPGRKHRLDDRQPGLPAEDDRGVVPRAAGVPERGQVRPRLLELGVLGGDADERMLLLNGSFPNDARGRGPQRQ